MAQICSRSELTKPNQFHTSEVQPTSCSTPPSAMLWLIYYTLVGESALCTKIHHHHAAVPLSHQGLLNRYQRGPKVWPFCSTHHGARSNTGASRNMIGSVYWEFYTKKKKFVGVLIINKHTVSYFTNFYLESPRFRYLIFNYKKSFSAQLKNNLAYIN